VTEAPAARHEEDDDRDRAMRTSVWNRTIQGCENGRGDRGFLPNLLADRSHRFVRDAAMARHASESLAFGPDSNVTPLVARDAKPLGNHCIASMPDRWRECSDRSGYKQSVGLVACLGAQLNVASGCLTRALTRED
jgi:hypothetical protein